MDINYTQEERIIAEIIVAARNVQEFIWGENSQDCIVADRTTWTEMFQKRADKIREVRLTHPHAFYELKKRLLQQAALSVKCIAILEEEAVSWCNIHDLNDTRNGLDEWLNMQEAIGHRNIQKRVSDWRRVEERYYSNQMDWFNIEGPGRYTAMTKQNDILKSIYNLYESVPAIF